MDSAVKAGEELLSELIGRKEAAGGTAIKKVSYTHDAMIELLILEGSKPGGISQKDIAAHFGYTEGWVSQVFSSDAFQSRLAVRKEEIIDPALKASLTEKFAALARRSLEVLMNKLNQTSCSDNVALRAAELGAKALGLGGHAPVPPTPQTDRLERLAARLLSLNAPQQPEKEIHGQVLEITKSR